MLRAAHGRRASTKAKRPRRRRLRLFTRQKGPSARLDAVQSFAYPFPTDGLDLLVRDDDGFKVTLFWSPSSDRTWVDVHDPDTGERLMFDAAPAKALEAFYDSFAYFFVDVA